MSALNRAVQVLTDDQQRARYDDTGETSAGNEPSREDKARMSLAKAFDDMLADDAELPSDVVAFLTKAIKGAMVEYEFEIKKIDTYMAKLDKKAVRVKYTGTAAGDLWAGTIEDRKKRYAAARAFAEEKLEVSKIALQLIKDEYENVPDPSPPPSKPPQDLYQQYGNDLASMGTHWYQRR